MIWEEVSFIQMRMNVMLASETVLLQAAISSVLSKDGSKHFNKLIKGLNTNGGK